jgi:maltose alpha-D-glucosyltransferase/alpha-amylase
VITELVINHTSDQHPWFQARGTRRGLAERNFYVWSDDPTAVRRHAHHLHRHREVELDLGRGGATVFLAPLLQPPAGPQLRQPGGARGGAEDHGVLARDGRRRLPARRHPYLIERDGTSNENLRETHDVIKAIRRRIDALPGPLLLAEANMWPEDVREYFGDGDECHMAYHFPLMPRMYMAIAQEDRTRWSRSWRRRPEIPRDCQWAIFLRNHDELTLEMVTSKERDYMYRMYATDPRTRINLGIRRRLAPLLENDRTRIELMNSLLLSMPGTPVLYYGDEIGMGDNIFLGDRDGVRTPMQWTSDRNGGFSRADPQRLYLPPIQDPIYGFEAVNVEAQARAPSSLLNWTRRLLAVREQPRLRPRPLHPAAPGQPQGPGLPARTRGRGDPLRGQREPLGAAGGAGTGLQGAGAGRDAGAQRFPADRRPALPADPAGHGFFWFRLTTDASPPDWHVDRLPVDDLAVLVLFDGWNSFFRAASCPGASAWPTARARSSSASCCRASCSASAGSPARTRAWPTIRCSTPMATNGC